MSAGKRRLWASVSRKIDRGLCLAPLRFMSDAAAPSGRGLNGGPACCRQDVTTIESQTRPPVFPLFLVFSLAFPGHARGFAPDGRPSVTERQVLMALYEHVFLARPDVSAQQVEALNAQFKTIIEEKGGSISKVEYWGLKSLSFRMKKNRKAHYTLLNIDAPADALAEMERQMGLNEDILRFITIRVDEHEDGPSAMLQRRERDERRDRDRDERRDRPPRRDRDDRSDDGDRPERAERSERSEPRADARQQAEG